jgi:hypothetical protein
MNSNPFTGSFENYLKLIGDLISPTAESTAVFLPSIFVCLFKIIKIYFTLIINIQKC